MSIKVKDGAVWKEANKIYVKKDGVWTNVLEAHIKDGGVWKPFFYDVFNFTISSDVIHGNLRSLAVAAGWNETSEVVATIDSGVYVYSTSTATPALTVNGDFPYGVTIVNNGYIIGMGGAGGNGGTANFPGGLGADATPGGDGGTAIAASVALTIINNNTVAGGGGGGGGGLSGYDNGISTSFSMGGGGGGGGRSAKTNSAAGIGGVGSGAAHNYTGSDGTVGTLSAAGTGGAGDNVTGFWDGQYFAAVSGSGGDGGNWGQAGSHGTNGGSIVQDGASAAGGAAGHAATGNSNITWSVVGTRLGTLS